MKENFLAHQESQVKDYFLLLKPRVMSLVIFTAIIGMLIAPGNIHLVTAISSITFIALGSGAAGCLNMWYESNSDALMKRTKTRPIPAGRIERSEALHLGLWLSAISVILMAIFVNMIASILLFTSIIYYVIIYTIILKKRTPQNIVIGGGAGAIPPVIGWASVTNDISLTPIILFFIIFLWTPPHFWALALTTKQDYKAANIPMLPNISGDESTKNQIIVYSILLWAFTILPYFLNIFGTFYFITANILSAIFLMLAIKLKFSKDINFNKKFFFFTIVYLFLLFTIMPFSS